ncbi:hypothetical protein ACJX0J_009249, partial [Zea mays]
WAYIALLFMLTLLEDPSYLYEEMPPAKEAQLATSIMAASIMKDEIHLVLDFVSGASTVVACFESLESMHRTLAEEEI